VTDCAQGKSKTMTFSWQ